ncbi:MAG: hypothetical protein Q4A31_08995 [Corynebacterium sp.]|uniref:hypothetical protein n=1 Tax=Corynebacterium sp. TaxID=1720 RepID=UPI0026DB84DB|nr:hypothetical protein [Corynebacterium sp.]MDO4762040.1 hypothetical protein [Corynebacterium sp.]
MNDITHALYRLPARGRMRALTEQDLQRCYGPLEYLTATIVTPWLSFDRLPVWQKRKLRARACVLSYPRAVLSGWAAADILGIGVLARDDVIGEVCLTYAGKVRSGGSRSLGEAILFSNRDLPVEDIVEVDGVQCTSIARTFVDIQYYYGELESLCFIESALSVVSGLTKEEIASRLRQLDGLRGVVGAKKVLARAQHRVGSVMETYLRYLIEKASRGQYRGLVKTIEVQACVSTPEGNRFPDLLINGWLIVEFDGVSKYGDTIAEFRRAKRLEEHRQILLLKQGFRIVRCTYQDVGPGLVEVIMSMLSGSRRAM